RRFKHVGPETGFFAYNTFASLDGSDGPQIGDFTADLSSNNSILLRFRPEPGKHFQLSIDPSFNANFLFDLQFGVDPGSSNSTDNLPASIDFEGLRGTLNQPPPSGTATIGNDGAWLAFSNFTTPAGGSPGNIEFDAIAILIDYSSMDSSQWTEMLFEPSGFGFAATFVLNPIFELPEEPYLTIIPEPKYYSSILALIGLGLIGLRRFKLQPKRN
ncbi:MAG: hypothetical protein LR015_09755, partial [Verrucomicrobia bacterium]|nr:hypothetical protein [Verrucomicrobiota bacterium]